MRHHLKMSHQTTQQTTMFLVQNNKTLMVSLHADILDLKTQQLLSFRN